ncbi:putative membrane protein [Gulosibacter sp. 10]|nr:putative membrane protein [Gulosibacter sp. 10]
MTLPGLAPPAKADVEDFSFSSWHTDIEVSVEQGPFGGDIVRSHFTETIVADFPEFDQNKGIVRAIPVRMGEQTMRIEDISVTDGAGNPVPFEQSQGHGSQDMELSLGDDDYVHGETTYVIEYSLVNTMRDYGYGWQKYSPNLVPPYRDQPIHEFSADVHLPTELMQHAESMRESEDRYEGVNGLNIVCYQDSLYSTGTGDCEVSMTEDGATTTLSIAPVDIEREAVTLDVSFADTATNTGSALNALTWPQLVALLVFLGTIVLAAIAITVRIRGQRAKPLGPVITRYSTDIEPVRASILLANGAKKKGAGAFAPNVLFAAVRGVLRIEPDEGRKPSEKRTTLRLIGDIGRLPSVTRKFVRTVLALSEREGSTRTIGFRDASFAKRWDQFLDEQYKAAQESGDIGPSAPERTRKIFVVVSLLIMVGAALWVVLGWAHVSEDLMAGPLIAAVLGIAALIWMLSALSSSTIRLTEQGQQAFEELQGLKQYITLAEAERLAALQDAHTAERTEAEGRTVIQVYERLLPYAALFGYTRSWSTILGQWYEHERTSPTWMPDTTPVSSLHTNISHLETSARASVVYESSSSGGYSGGGSFSGGGSAGGGFGGGSVGGR